MAPIAKLFNVQVFAPGFGLVGSFQVISGNQKDAEDFAREWAKEHKFKIPRVKVEMDKDERHIFVLPGLNWISEAPTENLEIQT